MTQPTFRHGFLVAVACGALALAGCSQPEGGAPTQDNAQAQAHSKDAQANRQLATYRELLRIKNDQMAASLGQDIVDRYPGTAAAKEVQQTLPDIRKRWKAESESRRLQGLWLYQVGPMEGGTQSTATIDSSTPAGNDRVRLVLRRHSDWGDSAFLYGGGHGFVCKGNCLIPASFDGKPRKLRAYLPNGGEPAIFIRDDKAFVEALEKAKKITLDVVLQDGDKHETLTYEVGGFDPSKWQPVAHKGAKKK
ncbi:hypothetical protein QMK61_01855 [Fulvimonas sp. R45]|uniref:hypothetical protein n=1 Tax=Fulvimonas sp. R45 TaxID=3045937 RepID=UPI00265E9FC3|nr:hypothetical protein [Fulvimonas sp. R45]MDO1527563.1 hypothetical protein [Fulvimonas sp. R45]